MWGTEDEATLALLRRTKIIGRWLNLCAGDGRFNSTLLATADEVTAVDIDERALQKLHRITPDALKPKLNIRVINIVEPFPFEDRTFDGIFCVGTLHLFPKKIIQSIFGEMERTLTRSGVIIIDLGNSRFLPPT